MRTAVNGIFWEFKSLLYYIEKTKGKVARLMIWKCRFESCLYFIDMNAEVLLSIAMLSLVLYGINLSTLKISILVIFIVGMDTSPWEV